jgi:type VI protein secretion system component VasA
LIIVSANFYATKKEYHFASDLLAIPYYMESELLPAQTHAYRGRKYIQRYFCFTDNDFEHIDIVGSIVVT